MPAAWYAVGGAAVSAVGSWIGGNKAAKAAKEQAEAQNAAARRRLQYDTAAWSMGREKLMASRDHAAETVRIAARNEGRLAAFKDASNLQRYNYDLQIRNAEQASLNNQYIRSDDIYNEQITLNEISAAAGVADEYRKLDEIRAETHFNSNEVMREQLLAEGKMRAMGSSGRSAAKGIQSTLADYSRQLMMLDASAGAAGDNARAVFEQIATDKTSANLAAYAQKMLDPGILPMPLVPFATPMSEFQLPRELEAFDFGPAPVLGAQVSASAAADAVWGQTISSIAGAVGSGLQSYGAGQHSYNKGVAAGKAQR
tara:strand:- start:337 stop:1275 length:939 start_codon:yes stop_codon:yes gene_type:complete